MLRSTLPHSTHNAFTHNAEQSLRYHFAPLYAKRKAVAWLTCFSKLRSSHNADSSLRCNAPSRRFATLRYVSLYTQRELVAKFLSKSCYTQRRVCRLATMLRSALLRHIADLSIRYNVRLCSAPLFSASLYVKAPRRCYSTLRYATICYVSLYTQHQLVASLPCSTPLYTQRRVVNWLQCSATLRPKHKDESSLCYHAPLIPASLYTQRCVIG